jgi:hypothetical protein
MFQLGKPGGECFGEVRKAARFASAEKESSQPQGGEIPHAARDGGERRPPQHDAQQDLSRADPIAQPTAGDLE